MSTDQALDVCRIKNATPFTRPGQQQIADKIAQAATEPSGKRPREAVLRPVDDLVRQKSSKSLLEDVLGLSVAKFEFGRNRCCKFDKLVIEQRHSRLDRVSHAHS